MKNSLPILRAVLCGAALTLSCVVDAFADQSYRYTVVGTVKALPGGARAANELLVKHEEIPNYRDSSGKVVGMMAMTMPFYISSEVSISDVKVGDRIEMVVEQHLTPRFTEEVVSVKRAE